jgi:hypothetical protein
MVLGFAGTAFAATGEIAPKAFSDIAGDEAEAELTLLAALGVYSGELGLGGPVKPGDPITRAQFCKVVVVSAGRGTTAQGLMGLKPSFKDDVPTWAWGYVNVAVYMGIIKGYEDGTFRSNNPVTYAEAITMLIRSVSGHVAQVGAGVWPYSYLFYGVDNGFAGSVDVGFANLPATRGDMARMLYATMQIDKVNKDGVSQDDTSVLAGRIVQGIVTDYAPGTVTIGGVHDLGAKVYLVGASDYEGLRNLSVTAVEDADGRIFFIAVGETANVVRGIFKGLIDADADGLTDAIELADGTRVAVNEGTGVSVTLNKGTGYNAGNLSAGDELIITLAGGGQAANVIALTFDMGEDYVNHFDKSIASPATDTYIALANGNVFSIPAGCQVQINGAAATRDDLRVDDVVTIATQNLDSNTPIVIRAIRQAVEGTVKTTTTTYPGPIYRVTIDKKGGGTQAFVLDLSYISMPSGGASVKFGLNAAGELFVPIGYATLTPYVVITGYTVDGDGHQTVTVDVRGQSATYRCDGYDFSSEIGQYYLIGIDTANGSVNSASALGVGGDYEILAIDVSGGTMTVQGGGTIYFVANSDAVVYKIVGGSKVYIGFAGLKVGDHVQANNVPSSAAVFELMNP